MAKKSDFQINLEFYAAKILFKLLELLPRVVAIRLGLLVGDIAYLCLGKLKRVAEKNIEIAFPNLSETEKNKLIRGSFRSLGRQLGELCQFPNATKESLAELLEYPFSDEEWTNYRKLKEEGRGIIFLTPHLGGWEVLAFASSALLEPQSYLVRRLDNPRLEALAENLRGRFGNQPIDKAEAALPAMKLLREGGNLGILADLNTQKHEGVFVPFFDKLACTTAGVAALAMRTKSVVVLFGCPYDEKKRKYTVKIGGVWEFESSGNDRKQDIINFTAKFTKATENLVREFPDQWLWIHKRWKTRPEGEEEIY